MPLPSKRPGRKRKIYKRAQKSRKAEPYSDWWWIKQVEKFKGTSLYAWGREMSLQILGEKLPKRRKELHRAVGEKLRKLSREGNTDAINAIVSGFVIRGADDLIIGILRRAKLFPWAGKVYENRGVYEAAGYEYFKAGDKRNLRRMIEKLRAGKGSTGKGALISLRTCLKMLEREGEAK